jgi:hypothetical protein
MPSSFIEFVLYFALLVPGYVYMVGRERNGPERKLDGFRQLANVLFVSVIAELVALAILLPFWSPHLDEERLLSDPAAYWRAEPVLLLWGYLTGLALAASLAYIASLPRVRKRVNRMLDRATGLFSGGSFREDIHPSVTSAWWRLFVHYPESILKRNDSRIKDEAKKAKDEKRDRGRKQRNRRKSRQRNEFTVLVSALLILSNGTKIQGYVETFNPSSDDSPERDLILKGPILRRAADQSKWVEMHSDYATFSRADITELYTEYECDFDWT